MISMTWPQYLRRECRIEDFVVSLSPIETELLAVLLIRYPAITPVEQLVEAVYSNPDEGPEWPEDQIFQKMRSLSRKVGTFRIQNIGRSFGYMLFQTPADLAA